MEGNLTIIACVCIDRSNTEYKLRFHLKAAHLNSLLNYIFKWHYKTV